MKPKKKVQKVQAPKLQHNVARDTEMFAMHMQGKTYKQIAAHFNLSEENINRVAKKYDWRGLKREFVRRRFAATMDEVKGWATSLMQALMRDADLIIAEAVKEKRQLSEEERTHFTRSLDRAWKEVRLEDGKPTEHNSGTLSVEVRLPPGVKRFGLIPPGPGVKFVEAQEVKTRPVLDLDAVETVIGDSKGNPKK